MNTIEVTTTTSSYYLVFILSKKQFALPLEAVQRVVYAVEVTLLPQAPEIVCGLVNYKGLILPVLNIARRFRLQEKPIDPEQSFIIVYTPTHSFALVADTVSGVIQPAPENVVAPDKIVAGVQFLSGVMKLDNGMMLIPDLEKLLTHEEELTLNTLVGKKIKKNPDA